MDTTITFHFSGDKTFNQSMEITDCTNVHNEKKKNLLHIDAKLSLENRFLVYLPTYIVPIVVYY